MNFNEHYHGMDDRENNEATGGRTCAVIPVAISLEEFEGSGHSSLWVAGAKLLHGQRVAQRVVGRFGGQLLRREERNENEAGNMMK